MSETRADERTTEQRLLIAAEKLFQEQGFDATTVAGILHEAGLSKGAFYHNFDSKEQLFAAVVRTVAARSCERADRIVGCDDSSEEKLRAFIVDLVRDLALNGARAYNDPSALFETSLFADAVAERRRYEMMLVELISQGQAAGVLRSDLSDRVVAKGILGMAMSTTDWFDRDGALTAHELAEQFADDLLTGVMERP